MHVPNNAMVLVADGRKMLFLRNEGDDQYLNLVVEHAQEQVNPADRDQKTDAAGGSSGSQMGAGAPGVAQGGGTGGSRGQGAGFAPSRGSMEETDFHQLEEDRFAAEAAELLKKRALNNQFESLIIVAPPKTLGEMRKHYHVEVEKRLKGELDKDLTGHPIPEIEAALQKA